MIGWQVKAVAAVIVVAAVTFAVFKVASWRSDAIEYKARAASLETALAVQVENTRKANAASKAYQDDLARLSAERDKPLSVRLCRPAPVRPASGAPAGPNAAATGHVGGEAAQDPVIAGPDIGNALLEYGIACEANALQLDRLQKWIRAR